MVHFRSLGAQALGAESGRIKSGVFATSRFAKTVVRSAVPTDRL